jgi:SHS2 domain-containing protein
MGFRLLEHSADLILEAWGEDLERALDQAVAALGWVLAGPVQAPTLERRPVSLPDPEPEALVVALLSECLYLLEVDAWLARGCQLEVGPRGVTGSLLGEPHVPQRHEGTDVKAITWHQLSVRPGPQGLTITVTVDC